MGKTATTDPEQVRAVCEKIFLSQCGDKPLLLSMVSNVQLEKRILAVGSYRVALFKPEGKGKFSLKGQSHYFDMVKVSCDSSRVYLEFKKFLISMVDLEPAKMQNILKTLLQAYSTVTEGWPAKEQVTLNLKNTLPVKVPKPKILFGGYRESYLAYCNFMNKPATKEFVEAIELLPDRILSLSSIPAFIADRVELVPVMMALRYNNWFTCVRIEGYSKPGLLKEHLARVFACNRNCRKLALINCGIKSDEIAPFGKTVQVNKEMSLCEIDLSQNNIGNDGFIQLEKFLQIIRLRSLVLMNCGASENGTAGLLMGLSKNPRALLKLMELNLSYNKLGTKGTKGLCEFLSCLRQANKTRPKGQNAQVYALEFLSLAHTELDIHPVIVEFYNSCEVLSNLKKVHIGDNKVNETEAINLSKTFPHIKKLEELSLANTGIVPTHLASLLKGMLKNENITRFSYDISQNNLGGTGLDELGPILQAGGATILKCAELNMCKLSEQGLTDLASRFATTRIQSLSLNVNYKYSSKTAKNVAENLGKSLSQMSQLTSLSIRGNDETHYLGKEGLQLLVDSLSGHKTLQYLDLSLNRGGNEFAFSVARLLSRKTSVNTLMWDGNRVNLEGYEEVRKALAGNSTLSQIDYPEKDVKKAGSGKKLLACLDEISKLIHNNLRQQMLAASQPKPVPKPAPVKEEKKPEKKKKKKKDKPEPEKKEEISNQNISITVQAPPGPQQTTQQPNPMMMGMGMPMGMGMGMMGMPGMGMPGMMMGMPQNPGMTAGGMSMPTMVLQPDGTFTMSSPQFTMSPDANGGSAGAPSPVLTQQPSGVMTTQQNPTLARTDSNAPAFYSPDSDDEDESGAKMINVMKNFGMSDARQIVEEDELEAFKRKQASTLDAGNEDDME